MTDPSAEDWREIMAEAPKEWRENTVSVGDNFEYANAVQEWVKHPHRYTYPADVGDVPAGTKFDHDIDAPSHYTHLPVEAIDITEHFNFNMGNALKYIWRADYKGDPLKDLRKAAWYINREIARRERS